MGEHIIFVAPEGAPELFRRGIGRAIALKLADEGAAVVINDLDEAPAQEVLAELQERGHAAHALPGDVTAADFGDRLIAETLDKFGSIDITGQVLHCSGGLIL